MRRFIAGAAVLATAACTAPPPLAGNCPALASRNWHAWIDRMPGPGSRPTLNISGEVDLPTSGYSVELRPGPMDRAMPPGQRFTLVATPPGGMVTQVVTPTSVSYREQAMSERYREIIIVCGDTALATITDVTITD